MAKHKILSLDGGGSWALIQAKILKDLYGNIKGHELLKKFDLAIGNSGGSLVLTALCANKSLDEIIEIFTVEEKRNKAFVKEPEYPTLFKWVAWISSKIKGMLPKYSADKKLSGLKELIGNEYSGKLLSEIPALVGKPNLQILILGFDYTRNRAKFFRSNKTSAAEFSKFDEVYLIEAAHASSNAPIRYFDNPAKVDVNLKNQNGKGPHELFWDGAVSGFNNPVLGGVLEYLVNNPTIDRKDIVVLTIGTGSASKPTLVENDIIAKQKFPNLYVTPERLKYVGDVEKLSTSILADPPDAATYIAQVMLDADMQNAVQASNIVRMNPCICPVRDIAGTTYSDVLDYPLCYRTTNELKKDFDTLMDMDMDATENEQVDLIRKFTDFYLSDGVYNQLIRGSYYVPRIIGSKLYSQAKERWETISA
ncbi:MAG: patatin-like phospholipase family protein [Bacteroidetes bacterium]|nr:patatin-like phospholipase family protein [Bacteroidota bacterium]